ncbi:MAG: pyridoxal phosphate-dependent aminotransferase [Burkholderiaceae bacterium]
MSRALTLPAFARRTDHVDPFFVMELAKQAVALEQSGKPIIHLSIGEPDFTAPPGVQKALQAAAESGRTQYTEALGLAALREAIAGDYQRRHGLAIDPGRILVTAGASGALTLACAAMVNPGDRVLLADPGYPCNRHFVAAFDGVPQMVPTGVAQRFQLTPSLLQAHWQADTRGMLLSSPANPTGTSVPEADLRQMLDQVRERGGFSLVDEIYQGLSYGEPALTALAMADDVIVTNSFSKYFHMTGWRLGWLVLPAKAVPTFEKLAQNLFICASTLAQRAVLACFEPENLAIYEARHAEFHRRRDYLVPALRRIGIDVPVTPDGAFYVYADISRFSNDSTRFAFELLEHAHVAVVPGKDFGFAEPERYIRISYASSMENLEMAVARIGAYLAQRADAA